MNKKLLVLPVSILVLAACTTGTSGSTGSTDAGSTGSTDTGSTSTDTGTSTAPEYISQAALDSLEGHIKLSGTYTLTDYTSPEYTYSGTITTIFEGDEFYRINSNDYGTSEISARNVNGDVAIVGLSADNTVVAEVYEDESGDTIAWEDFGANPLEDFVAANFVKQSEGVYSATNAEDRSLLGYVAYGNYTDISSATVTVTGDVITSISFTSASYVDEFQSTMVDSGTVTVSDHGTATVPEITAKPVVSEHTDLATALAALASVDSVKITTSEDYYDDDTGELTGEPTVWDEYFTPTAYYSTYEQDVSEDDTPVYVTNGYVASDVNGAYGFTRSEDGSVELTSNYPSITDLTEIKSGYYEGFAPALLESQGSGVFAAYEDTIEIVAPYLIMDEMALENDITSIVVTVESGAVSSIAYEYDYYFWGVYYLATYSAEVTFDTVNTTIPVDLTNAFALANVFAEIDEEGMMGVWTDGTNTLVIGAVSITFNGEEATNIEVLGAIFTFNIGDVEYRVEFTDNTETSLRVEPDDGGAIMTLTPPSVAEMPADIKEAVVDTLGVELTLPGVEGGDYSYSTGTSDDGPYIVIHIDNTTLDEYIAILVAAGFDVYDYMDSDGMWYVDDPDELIWPQVYDGEYSGIDIYIWNY